MNIQLIKELLEQGVKICNEIELTNEMYGNDSIGNNNILHREYSTLGSKVYEAVNQLDEDLGELKKAKELADFHKANKLNPKGNARQLTDGEMIGKFGMTAVQIAETFHNAQLTPYESN